MEKELQSLGFIGIWKESIKMIYTWRDIFLRLGLTLILPVSFMYLAHIEISFRLIQSISTNKITLAKTMNSDETSFIRSLMASSRDLAEYTLIPAASIFFAHIFSLISTSAVIYTVACIFSNKKVTFKDVLRIVPKVWKRLMGTLYCCVAIVLVYHFVFSFVVIIIDKSFPFDPKHKENYNLFLATFAILYFVGFFYMTKFWQLANVVSVLEEKYGFQALRRSKSLLKGKRRVSRAVTSISSLCVGGAIYLYVSYVVVDRSNTNVAMFTRVGFGVISLLLLSIFTLLGLVVKTVLYFVCKSYHNEQIDKTALADHLGVYHVEGYVLLKSIDVIQHVQVMEQV